MIVHEELRLPAAPEEVARRLLAYLRVDGLHAASTAAVEDGAQLVLRAGVGGLSKQVAVETLPPYHRGDTMVLPLRWSATGPLGEAFPTLDANLELDAADGGARLLLVGSYRPPLGRLGATLDRVLLGQVAAATIRSFLSRLEHGITS